MIKVCSKYKRLQQWDIMLLSMCRAYLYYNKTQLLRVNWEKMGYLFWAKHLSEMRSKTYCYWEKEQHHHVVILPTRKIAHLFSDIIVVYYTADIPQNCVQWKNRHKNTCKDSHHLQLMHIIIKYWTKKCAETRLSMK